MKHEWKQNFRTAEFQHSKALKEQKSLEFMRGKLSINPEAESVLQRLILFAITYKTNKQPKPKSSN